eukprot:jgi/Mesvir1/9278/Mv25014-RA.1
MGRVTGRMTGITALPRIIHISAGKGSAFVGDDGAVYLAGISETARTLLSEPDDHNCTRPHRQMFLPEPCWRTSLGPQHIACLTICGQTVAWGNPRTLGVGFTPADYAKRDISQDLFLGVCTGPGFSTSQAPVADISVGFEHTLAMTCASGYYPKDDSHVHKLCSELVFNQFLKHTPLPCSACDKNAMSLLGWLLFVRETCALGNKLDHEAMKAVYEEFAVTEEEVDRVLAAEAAAAAAEQSGEQEEGARPSSPVPALRPPPRSSFGSRKVGIPRWVFHEVLLRLAELLFGDSVRADALAAASGVGERVGLAWHRQSRSTVMQRERNTLIDAEGRIKEIRDKRLVRLHGEGAHGQSGGSWGAEGVDARTGVSSARRGRDRSHSTSSRHSTRGQSGGGGAGMDDGDGGSWETPRMGGDGDDASSSRQGTGEGVGSGGEGDDLPGGGSTNGGDQDRRWSMGSSLSMDVDASVVDSTGDRSDGRVLELDRREGGAEGSDVAGADALDGKGSAGGEGAEGARGEGDGGRMAGETSARVMGDGLPGEHGGPSEGIDGGARGPARGGGGEGEANGARVSGDRYRGGGDGCDDGRGSQHGSGGLGGHGQLGGPANMRDRLPVEARVGPEDVDTGVGGESRGQMSAEAGDLSPPSAEGGAIGGELTARSAQGRGSGWSGADGNHTGGVPVPTTAAATVGPTSPHGSSAGGGSPHQSSERESTRVGWVPRKADRSAPAANVATTGLEGSQFGGEPGGATGGDELARSPSGGIPMPGYSQGGPDAGWEGASSEEGSGHGGRMFDHSSPTDVAADGNQAADDGHGSHRSRASTSRTERERERMRTSSRPSARRALYGVAAAQGPGDACEGEGEGEGGCERRSRGGSELFSVSSHSNEAVGVERGSPERGHAGRRHPTSGVFERVRFTLKAGVLCGPRGVPVAELFDLEDKGTRSLRPPRARVMAAGTYGSALQRLVQKNLMRLGKREPLPLSLLAAYLEPNLSRTWARKELFLQIYCHTYTCLTPEEVAAAQGPPDPSLDPLNIGLVSLNLDSAQSHDHNAHGKAGGAGASGSNQGNGAGASNETGPAGDRGTEGGEGAVKEDNGAPGPVKAPHRPGPGEDYIPCETGDVRLLRLSGPQLSALLRGHMACIPVLRAMHFLRTAGICSMLLSNHQLRRDLLLADGAYPPRLVKDEACPDTICFPEFVEVLMLCALNYQRLGNDQDGSKISALIENLASWREALLKGKPREEMTDVQMDDHISRVFSRYCGLGEITLKVDIAEVNFIRFCKDFNLVNDTFGVTDVTALYAEMIHKPRDRDASRRSSWAEDTQTEASYSSRTKGTARGGGGGGGTGLMLEAGRGVMDIACFTDTLTHIARGYKPDAESDHAALKLFITETIAPVSAALHREYDEYVECLKDAELRALMASVEPKLRQLFQLYCDRDKDMCTDEQQLARKLAEGKDESISFVELLQFCQDLIVMPSLIERNELENTFRAANFIVGSDNNFGDLNFEEFVAAICIIGLLAFSRKHMATVYRTPVARVRALLEYCNILQGPVAAMLGQHQSDFKSAAEAAGHAVWRKALDADLQALLGSQGTAVSNSLQPYSPSKGRLYWGSSDDLGMAMLRDVLLPPASFPPVILGLVQRATIAQNQSDYRLAVDLLMAAEDDWRSMVRANRLTATGKLDPSEELFFACAVGGVHASKGADEDAQAKFEEALRYSERLTTGHPDKALPHSCLGVTLYHQGKLWEAFEHLMKAKEFRETGATCGPVHVDTALVYNNLAAVLDALGHVAWSLKLLSHATKVCTALVGHANPRTQVVARNLGKALRKCCNIKIPKHIDDMFSEEEKSLLHDGTSAMSAKDSTSFDAYVAAYVNRPMLVSNEAFARSRPPSGVGSPVIVSPAAATAAAASATGLSSPSFAGTARRQPTIPPSKERTLSITKRLAALQSRIG